jgi:hypothetical protein
MLFTKEFYEAMEMFEKTAKDFVQFGSMGLTREPIDNWIRTHYYSDGNANEAFKIFLIGMSYGKSLNL